MDDDLNQTSGEGQDAIMTDAPSTEISRKKPKKLDHRLRWVPRRERADIQEVSEQVIQTATSYRVKTVRSDDFTSAHEAHQTPSTTRGTAARKSKSKRDVDHDDESIGRRETDPFTLDLYGALPLQHGDRTLSSAEQKWQQIKVDFEDTIRQLQGKHEQWQTNHDEWIAAEVQWKADENDWKAKAEIWRSREASYETRIKEQSTQQKNMELETERVAANRKKLEAKEKQLEDKVKDVTARWKSTAELLEKEKLRAQNRGLYRVTDAYLEEMIIRLRYNIRSFAIQYFSGAIPKRLKFEVNSLWKRCKEPITGGSDGCLDYMESSEKRTHIVQAFLWRIIVYRVLNRFRSAGTAWHSMLEMYELLENPARGSLMSSTDAEGVKKFHAWRATTVGLLLDSTKLEKRPIGDDNLNTFKPEMSSIQPADGFEIVSN